MTMNEKLVEFRRATKAFAEDYGRIKLYDEHGILVIDSDCWDVSGEALRMPEPECILSWPI